jgi:hypothetical protein
MAIRRKGVYAKLTGGEFEQLLILAAREKLSHAALIRKMLRERAEQAGLGLPAETPEERVALIEQMAARLNLIVREKERRENGRAKTEANR